MSGSANTTAAWSTIPTELKLTVASGLDTHDVKALSAVDRSTYEICVPFMFKYITIGDFATLLRFLEEVPRSYYRHIEELDLSTQIDLLDGSSTLECRTEAVVALLLATRRLSKLTLRVGGSLGSSVVAPFNCLHNLKHLKIMNLCDEVDSPLSERLVVSMAASLPCLQHLSLDRITRSKFHAPELEGVFPFVPVVINDDDLPDHPVLGSELSLPSLLRIPTLRELAVRDTHLGDHRWATTPIDCQLQILDLGSCYHETEEVNSVCTQRIMAAVGPTIDEFSLNTTVNDAVFARPSATPLQRLRKLHISPFFPVDSVVDTMSTLAGSPIESLSMQCYEDDVVDVCSALEEFLNLRVERGPDFYGNLSKINLSVTTTDDITPTSEEQEERLAAFRRLEDFCRDLKLSTAMEHAVAVPGAGEKMRTNCSPVHEERCPPRFCMGAL
ncbi:hypothetical protein BDN72DRAFT_960911 [Pluteus cervinus]|uniref:Uncharacterized protein n=1 Tax=Pluteus cervinus TaxID=181527 RepID=A0ACD3APZ3_9AGAR|nr:hypothetical protein BDN72DRAFT_960911 [Pluteus cervinus]